MIALCLSGIGIALFFVLLSLCRQQPAAKAEEGHEATPVYLTFADKPDRILSGMDSLLEQARQVGTAAQRWRWAPLILFAGGMGLIWIDGLFDLFGYTSIVFTSGGILIWIAAFVMAIALRRKRAQAFPPRYQEVRQMLFTLRDDLRRGSTFLGHLDLSGTMLPSKVAREAHDSQNRTTQYFRDEWLNLKAKLYDGNILRLSAIERIKQRKSYWKRGRVSGKMKLKPAKLKGIDQQLKVRIAVNPQVYEIVPNARFRAGRKIGHFTIATLNTQGGIIETVATSSIEEVKSENILEVLKSAYSLLKRKVA